MENTFLVNKINSRSIIKDRGFPPSGVLFKIHFLISDSLFLKMEKTNQNISLIFIDFSLTRDKKKTRLPNNPYQNTEARLRSFIDHNNCDL